MMWKILTAQIREEISNSLGCRGLHLEEQKGFCNGLRETEDLPYIDQHVFKEIKTRRKNVAMD